MSENTFEINKSQIATLSYGEFILKVRFASRAGSLRNYQNSLLEISTVKINASYGGDAVQSKTIEHADVAGINTTER